MRVGLGYLLGKPFSPQVEHKPVVLHRVDAQLRAVHLDAVQPLAKRGAKLGRDAARTAVNQKPIAVYGTEVAAGGHVSGLEFYVNPQRFQDASANLVFQRVVAEQRQVPRAAAGSDTRQDRRGQPAGALFRHGVEVGRVGRLQLG